jgi:hypothetical protein
LRRSSSSRPTDSRATIKQVSALYLLGYTKEMPLDGLFHRIKVRVKRGGVEVRAREGYWAPRAEDVEVVKARAAAAVLPPSVSKAFGALLAPNAPRLVDLWSGAGLPASGRVPLISPGCRAESAATRRLPNPRT